MNSEDDPMDAERLALALVMHLKEAGAAKAVFPIDLEDGSYEVTVARVRSGVDRN